MQTCCHKPSSHHVTKRQITLCMFFVIFIPMMILPVPAEGSFHEQMAISAQAISLGNAVTAHPPGHMSIHYNPAGLSLMPEGKWFSQGLTIPVIQKTSKFEAAPDFEGFFGFNDDPLVRPNGHGEGTNTSGRMYLPIVDTTIDFLFSPTVGISCRKPGSPWTFAIGNYAPFAVGLVHGDSGDPTRFGGKAVYQQHLVYAAPAVSYQINDSLSVGLTVGLGQTAMGAEVDMRSPNELVALTRILGDATEDLEIPVLSELTLPPPWFGGGVGPYDQVASLELSLRDDFSPNYNIGVLWEPWDWLSLGLVYQSPIKVELEGEYRFNYTETWQSMVSWFGRSPLLIPISGMLDLPIYPVPYQEGTVTSEMEFPQRIQMGIKIKPSDKLSLMFDLKWSNWSVLEEDRFEFDQDIQLFRVVKLLGYFGGNSSLVLKRDFKDTWDWAVGVEYALFDWLKLRAGYEWRESSVQDDLYDLMYALPDLHFFGGGCSLTLSNGVVIDLAGGYLVNEGYEVDNDGSTNLNSNDPFKPVYNPYAGLNYEQDTSTYMGSINVTMPFEVMTEMMHHQMEMGQMVVGFLNPFSSHDHEEGEEREPEPELEKDRSRDNQGMSDVWAVRRKPGVPDLMVDMGGFQPQLEDRVGLTGSETEQILSWLDSWRAALTQGGKDRLKTFYAPQAVFGEVFGRTRIVQNKQARLDDLVHLEIDDVRVQPHPRGMTLSFSQWASLERGGTRQGRTALVVEEVQEGWRILNEQWREAKLGPVRARRDAPQGTIDEAKLQTWLQSWEKAWERHDLDGYLGHYARQAVVQDLFGRKAIAGAVREDWKNSPDTEMDVVIHQASSHPRGIQLRLKQELTTQNEESLVRMVQLVLEAHRTGWQIINELRVSGDGRLKPEPDIRAWLEKWRLAQEEMNVQAYASFYAPQAIQGEVFGRAAICRAAQAHWTKGSVGKISLTHLQIRDHPRGKMISFTQRALGDGGRAEQVTLVLEREGAAWEIVNEQSW